MGGALSGTRTGYEWSDKELSRCSGETSNKGSDEFVLTNEMVRDWLISEHLSRWKTMPVPLVVLSHENVCRLYFSTEEAKLVYPPPDESLPTRKLRRAMLTQGALSLLPLHKERISSSGIIGSCFGSGDDDDVNIPDKRLVLALHQIRSVHVREPNLVEIYVVERANDGGAAYNGRVPRCVYQVPRDAAYQRIWEDVVLSMKDHVYVGYPSWAVPFQFQGPRLSPSLTSLPRNDGLGGLSNSVFALLEATCLSCYPQHRIDVPCEGADAVRRAIMDQQPASSTNNNNLSLDVVALIKKFFTNLQNERAGDNFKLLRELILTTVEVCLPFNLVVRRLIVSGLFRASSTDNTPTPTPQLSSALTSLLTYNVTLRELNLERTILTGLGRVLGQALASNIQPILTRWNLRDCALTQDDVDGLIDLGFRRLYGAGGSAVLEVMEVGESGGGGFDVNNWDNLYRVMLGGASPSLASTTTSSYYPPPVLPPPPNLAFLQTLDVRGTQLFSNTPLSEVLSVANHLRTLRLGCSHDLLPAAVLDTLGGVTSAHLVEFEVSHARVDGAQVAAALRPHQDTLKRITLDSVEGDVSPLLSNWPTPSKNLIVRLAGDCRGVVVTESSSTTGSSSPTTLIVREGVTPTLLNSLVSYTFQTQFDGLKSLTLGGSDGVFVHFCALAPAAAALTRLEFLEIVSTGTSAPPTFRGVEAASAEFWETMATSTTLHTLLLTDQLRDTSYGDALSQVGVIFLRQNRSVARMHLDSSHLTLTLDGVQALRGAFYGNKKVVELPFFAKAYQNYLARVRRRTQQYTNDIRQAKYEIKTLFKRHYSKYNWNWRDTPNRLKLPIVERIRVAKRALGTMERDGKKMAKLWREVQTCVENNAAQRTQTQQVKGRERLERRGNQLENMAKKKEKLALKLVTKLQKVKKNSRQNKKSDNAANVAKTPVWRGDYYKDEKFWKKPKNADRDEFHRYHWHGVNDPYHVRRYPSSSSSSSSSSDDDDDDGGHRKYGMNDIFDHDYRRRQVEHHQRTHIHHHQRTHIHHYHHSFYNPYFYGYHPWYGVNHLVVDSPTTDCLLEEDWLRDLHAECAELGPDVLAEIAPVIDECAALSDKIDGVSEDAGVDREEVERAMPDDAGAAAVAAAVYGTEAENDAVDEPDEDDDEVVDMYAGAGPRDLDDGGPDHRRVVVPTTSAARRRRHRREYRAMRRVRTRARNRASGYVHLRLDDERNPEKQLGETRRTPSSWPKDLIAQWTDDTTETQIQAIVDTKFFPFPDVSPSERVLDWSLEGRGGDGSDGIQVILVTQCSMDRLPNLKEQLSAWKGMASVAVHLNHDENVAEAKRTISRCVQEAKETAQRNDDASLHPWDVAVTVCQSYTDDAAYPINLLRNQALLEAKRRQTELGVSSNGAVFLVDVDFRPSDDLFRALHSAPATAVVCRRRRVVVCPAFECASTTSVPLPRTVPELLRRLEEGTAEGFHQSRFPRGHGPTDFARFASLSSSFSERATVDDFWDRLYSVPYENHFEPYVVMATEDVPLYDERFQGYGLNKISHLATVAATGGDDDRFRALPGVFVAARAHERSESWSRVYGAVRDDDDDGQRFRRLCLKALWRDHRRRLANGEGPSVSPRTASTVERSSRTTTTSGGRRRNDADGAEETTNEPRCAGSTTTTTTTPCLLEGSKVRWYQNTRVRLVS